MIVRIPYSMQIRMFWLLCGTLYGLFLPLPASSHGDVHERIAALIRQIGRETNNAQLFLLRGELYRQHQDWGDAAADYDRAVKLDPQLAIVGFCRARMFAEKGDLVVARAGFDEYLRRCPEDGRGFAARARLLVRMNERKSAVRDFTRAIELSREPGPELFLERAQLQIAEGKGSEALRGLDVGVAKLGSLISLQTCALDIELSRTNYDGALTRLQAIIDASPRKESALARRGQIELNAGLTLAAKRSFEASLFAVDALPERLRQSEAMVELRAKVEAELRAINMK